MAHNARDLLRSYYIDIVGVVRKTRMLDERQLVPVKCTLARSNIIRRIELHYLVSGFLSVRSEDDNARDISSSVMFRCVTCKLYTHVSGHPIPFSKFKGRKSEIKIMHISVL